MAENIPSKETVGIGADFIWHADEGKRGDEEVMGRSGDKEKKLEGHMLLDLAKTTKIAAVITYFQKREEHRVTYKSGGWSVQVDYILC